MAAIGNAKNYAFFQNNRYNCPEAQKLEAKRVSAKLTVIPLEAVDLDLEPCSK